MDPRQCEPCRKIYGILQEHHDAAPADPLRTEDIGRMTGLKTRAAQVHLRHLWTEGRIDADRRTPLGLMSSEPTLPGALDWAAQVVAPDPTCAKCLLALAALGWEGQIHTNDLAAAAGISPRSVERHRPHLIRADLVAFKPVSSTDPETGFVTRKVDRFTLLSQLTARPIEDPAEREAATARAAAVVRRVSWLADVTPTEREFAIKSVRWCMWNGWPDEALFRALDAAENRQAYNPNGYLAQLLRKLPREYVIPARQVYEDTAEERMLTCPKCDRAFWTTRPGKPLCGPCREAALAELPAQLTLHAVRVAESGRATEQVAPAPWDRESDERQQLWA
ncbi:hypothetical protein AB0C76_33080 [Kitasatospora sp. NPDC048722]|uniref:hypothetical protein n=1 Tax=Kitasatospora sp. NPDC048722 TaxID=3155639 RepID=UPI0033E02208